MPCPAQRLFEYRPGARQLYDDNAVESFIISGHIQISVSAIRMDNSSHDELRTAQERRARISESIHALSAELARLDTRIAALTEEASRAEYNGLPCWSCQEAVANDIRHRLRNHGHSIMWSPGGVPVECCRIVVSQRRSTSIGCV
jgi:hypothetical protein